MADFMNSLALFIAGIAFTAYVLSSLISTIGAFFDD